MSIYWSAVYACVTDGRNLCTESGLFGQQMTGNILRVGFLEIKIVGFEKNITAGQ